jgi:hypothetical protein
MKRPYDLVAFLEQEKRVGDLDILKDQLASPNKLDIVADRHEPDLEAKFYSKDFDCQAAGQPLTEFDLFASTLIHPDTSEMTDILVDEFNNLPDYNEPICSAAKPLHFELEVIDDLSVSFFEKDFQLTHNFNFAL